MPLFEGMGIVFARTRRFEIEDKARRLGGWAEQI